MYQRSPFTHFVHTDSIKIFDTNSQIYKEFVNSISSEQQQQAESGQIMQLNQQLLDSPPQPSSPASPTYNLDETFTAMQFSKEAIQSLIGLTIYNSGSNLLSSCSIPTKMDASTTTLTASSSLLTSFQISNLNSSLNKPLWFIGRVVHKEFCIARKANNRYKVPTGTQFYRVRIYPFKI